MAGVRIFTAATIFVGLALTGCGGEETRTAAETLPIRDDFEGECTWPQETTDHDEVSCANGEYKVVITSAPRLSYIPRRTQKGYASVSVSAKTTHLAQLTSEDLAFQGVGCWASGRGDPVLGYVFALYELGDGTRGYLIGRNNESDPELQQNPLRIGVLVDKESDSLPPVGSPAELRGECRKDEDSVALALYVDGERLASTVDTRDASAINAFVAYGFIAFASKSGTDFSYDDFLAEELTD